MNSQLEYHVVKAHIDELVRAAERARIAGGADSPSSATGWLGLSGRLRQLSARRTALTDSALCAECP